MPPARRDQVFLNVPYDADYERLLIALVAAVVSLGRTPRTVLEIPETGQGRLSRLIKILQSCGVSIHDLCRVEKPVRFNMPFELGLACAINSLGGPHQFILFERIQYRLDKTLSDIKGRDPYIHRGTPAGIIGCTLNALGSPKGTPAFDSVKNVDRKLWRFVQTEKQAPHYTTIFTRTHFLDVSLKAISLAQAEGLIP